MFNKLKKGAGVFFSLLLVLILLPCSVVYAEETTTDSYPMQYLEITVPDYYAHVTVNTKDSDIAWTEVNVTDPSTMKTGFKNSGIYAMYVNKNTNSSIYLAGISNEETLKVFDITKYSDEEIIEYGKTWVPTENVKSCNVTAYKHPQMNMFKMEIAYEGENEDKQIVYATIVNGMILEFSMDTTTRIGALRDDILQELISGVHMTKMMTYDEYAASVRKTWLTIGCFFGAGILLMVIFFVVNKITQKKRKLRVNAVSENLLSFRKRKQAGEVDTQKVLYEIETDYNKELVQSYSTYNSWLRNGKRDFVMALIYVLVVGYAVYLGSKLMLIIGVAAALIILYIKYSGCEKYTDNLIKRYDLKKKKSVTATYRFYDEYFTMSGIESISEYIYKQVFKVANYKGYMLLYISEESALVIDVEKVPEENRIDFIRMILEKSRI